MTQGNFIKYLAKNYVSNNGRKYTQQEINDVLSMVAEGIGDCMSQREPVHILHLGIIFPQIYPSKMVKNYKGEMVMSRESIGARIKLSADTKNRINKRKKWAVKEDDAASDEVDDKDVAADAAEDIEE